MWGDPKRAASLQGSDPLATLLFQVASPAHIPWGDARWQELLTGYDTWVHVEDSGTGIEMTIVSQACESMAKHAFVSSNLAALCLHVTRMLRELTRDIQKSAAEDAVADFSLRISRVAKARATAGSLQLLRLLCHSVILKCCNRPKPRTNKSNRSVNNIEDAFMYKTRGDLPCDQLASRPLLNSILDLIVVVGNDSDAIKTPEVYDALVLSFQLLLVLCGTQLYQNFESSFSSSSNQQKKQNNLNFILQELFADSENSDKGSSSSSSRATDSRNLRTFYASSRSSFSQTSFRESSQQVHVWTPSSLLEICLKWQIRRPPAPERSIAHYYYIMAHSAVAVKGRQMVKSPDGMYESHLVVQAAAPNLGVIEETEESSDLSSVVHDKNMTHNEGEHHNIILDATKGVITLSSKIVLLPFRLVSLVFGALVHGSNNKGGKDFKAIMAKKFKTSSSRTKDVLWLSNSIVTDLASCFVLLLANNNRLRQNPFRDSLNSLTDNRWDHGDDSFMILPDLPSLNFNEDDDSSNKAGSSRKYLTTATEKEDVHESKDLTMNFDSLFESFGRILHTEVGALMLYTLLKSSPSFAETLVARSDLDTLVLPLLRTLYFASQSNTYIAKDYAYLKTPNTTTGEPGSNTAMDIRSCPFRSQSQLYVIIILLLIFSQDSSFGRDAFRRLTIPNVLWYKERNLKHINLGSILFLTLLRSVLFSLNRLQDPFLLNNSCAILMNLSPSIVDLHEYAAMRLASVSVSVMKRHIKLRATALEKNGGNGIEEEEEDMASPLGMCTEVAQNLLSIMVDCLSPRKLDRNLHLVYALVYHQTDFTRIFKENKKLYPSKKTERILSITQTASSLIQEEGARSAPKALRILETQIDVLKAAAEKKRRKEQNDFTFTYEEEADPEVFFVPYVWEVIVSVVTSSTIEWKKDDIRAFSLLEPVEEEPIINIEEEFDTVMPPGTNFGMNGEDLV